MTNEYSSTYRRGWLGDTWKLLHWPRATIFYCNLVIGVFLAHTIRVWPTIMALIAMFFGLQIAAYAIDELRGRKTNTDLSDKELKWRTYIGLTIAGIIGSYLAITVSLLYAPLMMIGLIGIVGYNNNDGRGTFGSMHSRIFFGIIWAAFPMLAFYTFESLTVPPLFVWLLAGFATFFAMLHISTYGNFTCKSHKCLDLKNAKDEGLETFPGLCHGQQCAIRRQSIPREVHRLSRELTHFQDYSYLFLTAAIIALHFGV